MKQIKKHEFHDLDLEDVKIDDLITALQALKEKYHEYDLVIEEDNAYEGGYYHNLIGYKLETDEEEQSRIDRDNKYREACERNERQQYEILKAKFEPGPTPMVD